MMLFRRVVVVFSFLLLIQMNPVISARPGGQGDDDRAYDCSGSCHSESGQAGMSSISSIISIPQTGIIVGSAVTISMVITGEELLGLDLLGIFILGVSISTGDIIHPEELGWSIIQDPNGGSVNYVEVVPKSQSINVSFVLMAPQTFGEYVLTSRIHHGIDDGNEAQWSNGNKVEFDIIDDPDSAGRLLGPPLLESGYIGRQPVISGHVANANQVLIIWSITNDTNEQTVLVNITNGTFESDFPIFQSPVEIKIRFILSNGTRTFETISFKYAITEPPIIINEYLLYLQAIGSGLLLFSICIFIIRNLDRKVAGEKYG